MQSKNNSLRHRILRFVSVLLVLALTISLFSFVSAGSKKLTADAAEAAYEVSDVEITNPDFGEVSGSGTLLTPTSWTGEQIYGSSVKSGVVDLSDALTAAELDDLGLPENTLIRSPFGSTAAGNEFAGSDKNALFIGSDSDAIYAYDSTSVSLSANSYYEISVWVKTSDFGAGKGAAIKISGLENDIIIDGINTVQYYDGYSDPDNDADCYYGWVRYTFFIETSTMSGPSVTISLMLGRSITADDDETAMGSVPAAGYALFDHLTAKQYSYDSFENTTAGISGSEKNFEACVNTDRTYFLSDNGTMLSYSENDSVYLSVDGNGNLLDETDEEYENNVIGDFARGSSRWTAAPQSLNGKTSKSTGIFNNADKDTGITEDDIPYSPEGTNGSVLAISSEYDREKESFYTSASSGVQSPEFKIERRKNYRLSVWVNSVGTETAGLAIAGMDYRGALDDAEDPNNNGKGQLLVTSTNLGGDDDNTMRYGWSEEVFYIKGSNFADYDIRLELWLGMRATSDADAIQASGIALFGSIRIEEISGSEYTSDSSNGTTVTFDGGDDSGSISNGSFNNVEDIDYSSDGLPYTPYTPSDWTLMAAGENGTTGMSTDVYNENYTDYVVSGVISSDMTSYRYKRPDADSESSVIERSIDPAVPDTDTMPDNLLIIDADKNRLPAEGGINGNGIEGVAVGYRSLSFSAAANTVQRIDVTMRVAGIEGYGANLVLKSGDKEVATIQKIKDSNPSDGGLYNPAADGYPTYSFYVQTGDSSISELYLEIWLGMYDDERNDSKLSTGTVYVSEVKMTQLNAVTQDDEGNETADAADLNARRAEFAARVSEYKQSLKSGVIPDFACYSVYGSTIDSYNAYDDGYVKTAYNWTLSSSSSDAAEGTDAVTFGAYDMTAASDPDVLYEGYSETGSAADDSLIIKNNVTAYSRVTNDRSYTLDGGSYYRLTVTMQVYLPVSGQPEDFKGAYVGIDGTDYAISNIRSTVDKSGKYVFREYNLYIKTSGTAPSEDTESDSSDSTSTTTTITLVAGIGGESKTERAVGTLIINNIELTSIDSSQFESAQSAVQNSGSIGRTDFIADYTEGEDTTTEEDDTTDTTTEDASGNNWYIYISVVLAIVILIAVIAALVRYLAIRRKKNGERSPSEKLSYDRASTLLRQHNAREGATEDLKAEGYEAFDEDLEDRIETIKAMAEAESLAAENAGGQTAARSEETTAADEPAVSEAVADDAQSAEEQNTVPAEATAEDNAVNSDETAVSSADESKESSAVSDDKTETEAVGESGSDENTDADETAEEDEEYSYSDEIVDFTPSEERRKAFEEARAEKARRKAQKEAERKAEEEARARLEEERREATRRYNKWDDFED